MLLSYENTSHNKDETDVTYYANNIGYQTSPNSISEICSDPFPISEFHLD